MSLPHLSYENPWLGRLEPGTLYLRVPVLGEAVQINTTNIDNQKRLEVTIEASEIHVAREDGASLQIEDVFGPTNREHRIPVLVEPIAELLLNPGEGENVWSAAGTEGLRVYDTDGLGIFVGLVATFGMRSQGRERGKRETTTAAELLKLID